MFSLEEPEISSQPASSITWKKMDSYVGGQSLNLEMMIEAMEQQEAAERVDISTGHQELTTKVNKTSFVLMIIVSILSGGTERQRKLFYFFRHIINRHLKKIKSSKLLTLLRNILTLRRKKKQQ